MVSFDFTRPTNCAELRLVSSFSGLSSGMLRKEMYQQWIGDGFERMRSHFFVFGRIGQWSSLCSLFGINLWLYSLYSICLS